MGRATIIIIKKIICVYRLVGSEIVFLSACKPHKRLLSRPLLRFRRKTKRKNPFRPRTHTAADNYLRIVFCSGRGKGRQFWNAIVSFYIIASFPLPFYAYTLSATQRRVFFRLPRGIRARINAWRATI